MKFHLLISSSVLTSYLSKNLGEIPEGAKSGLTFEALARQRKRHPETAHRVDQQHGQVPQAVFGPLVHEERTNQLDRRRQGQKF